MAEETPRGGPGAKARTKGITVAGDIDPTNPSGDAPAGTLGTATEGKGPSSSKTLPSTYNKKAADALLEAELLDLLNIVPDAKTKAEFFKGLNAFLKAYGPTSGSSSSGTGTTTSSSVQGADATAPLGGKVGDTMRSLSSYAADMGVFKSPNEITSRSVDVITGKSRQEDILASYRKDAQALYANFAPRLAEDAGLTVRDLANPYIQMMADTFETASDNIKLTDDTIQKAINDSKGLINLGQFRSMLRNDKRFEVTSTAKREAADLGTAMLRSFGFGA